MSTFIIKLTKKEGGSVKYYRHSTTKDKLVDGILMTYTDYEFTDNELEARQFYTSEDAFSAINVMRRVQPFLASTVYAEVVRKMTDKELISLNTRPFLHILSLIRGYKEANEEGKTKIREKLFDNDELYNACDYALEQLNKFKKYCKK